MLLTMLRTMMQQMKTHQVTRKARQLAPHLENVVLLQKARGERKRKESVTIAVVVAETAVVAITTATAVIMIATATTTVATIAATTMNTAVTTTATTAAITTATTIAITVAIIAVAVANGLAAVLVVTEPDMPEVLEGVVELGEYMWLNMVPVALPLVPVVAVPVMVPDTVPPVQVVVVPVMLVVVDVDAVVDMAPMGVA